MYFNGIGHRAAASTFSLQSSVRQIKLLRRRQRCRHRQYPTSRFSLRQHGWL